MRAAGIVIAGFATGLVAVLVLCAQLPDVVEKAYVQGLGPPIQAALVGVSRKVSGSMAEWIEAFGIAIGVLAVAAFLVALYRGRTQRLLLVGDGLLALWLSASVIGALFYATWGLSYARPPAMARLGWSESHTAAIGLEELEALGLLLVNEVNHSYLELHGWPDGLSPTVAPDGLRAADAAIDVGYERLVADFGLHPTLARSRGPSKPLRSSVVFSYLGIGGFYFPFTAEANINRLAPEWQQPHTMAHEKAHQRFIASEDEANFFGFLACLYAEDRFVRYSGLLFAQRQVLRHLQKRADLRFDRLITRRLPGVQRDVTSAHVFWSQYDGAFAKLGDAVNDSYLRLNGVEGGVGSYSRSLELIVAWWAAGGKGFQAR